MDESRIQDRIEKTGRRVLRRAGIATRGMECGSSIVYEYSLGRMIGRPGAVPGLLLQLTGKRWYFTARSAKRDIVYDINVRHVVDITRVSVPEGVVAVIEADPTDDEYHMGLAEPTLYQFLCGGDDALHSANEILGAVGFDAGLVDASGRPTDFWKEVIEKGDTDIRRSLLPES